MRALPTSLSWLGGSVVLADPVASVNPDDFMRLPVPLEHASEVLIDEHPAKTNEIPAVTIIATTALRYGTLGRLPFATTLAAGSRANFADLVTYSPSCAAPLDAATAPTSHAR